MMQKLYASTFCLADEAEARFQGLSELDAIIKDLIDIGVEMRVHADSIDDVYQKLGQGESIVRPSGCQHSH
jgi:hypothetical protein